jgi:hypothetical protein
MLQNRRPTSCVFCHQVFAPNDKRTWSLDVSPDWARLNNVELRAHEDCLPTELRDILELDSQPKP